MSTSQRREKKTRVGRNRKEVKQKVLPTGWREVKLGKIVEIIGGGTPKTEVPEYWNGSIPWLTPPDFVSSNRWVNNSKKSITKLGLNRSPTKLLQKGDLIFSARGTVGAVAQVERPMAFSQTSYGLRVKPGIVINDFLFYLLRHNRKRIQKLSYGATFDTVTTKTFNFIAILLPSLPEQKAIASLLEKWDTAIEKTEALIAAKEKQSKWLLKTLINDQQNNPEWRKVKLGNLCTTILGGGTPSTANIGYWKGHIPWMTSADIVNAKTINTRKYITAQAVTDSATNLIPRNNIIVVTRVGIGKAVKNEMDICISQDSQGLILKKSVNADFLIHCLLEKIQVFKSVSQGSTIQGITKKRLFDIEFPLPSLPEQKQIAQHINIVEREIGLLKELIEKYRRQKRGLMQKLLTGEWRLIQSFPRKRE